MPTNVMYTRVRGRIALYFFMVLSSAEASSAAFPTLVAPDAVFFLAAFAFLVSREVSDAVLLPLLRDLAPPLNSRIDWILEDDDFVSTNGTERIPVLSLARHGEVFVDNNIKAAKHKLWNFKGLILVEALVCFDNRLGPVLREEGIS